MRIAQADGAYQDGSDLCDESCARVEEHPDNDRQHGIRNDIYIIYIVGNHYGCYYTIEHDGGEEQGKVSSALIIILTEQVEIVHETQNEDTDI